MTVDLLKTFTRLSGLVQHPALRLDLFTRVPLDDGADDEFDIELSDEAVAEALDEDDVREARQRRGALLYAANTVFDRILDDILARLGVLDVAEELTFVDEHLPARFRRGYDVTFLRKLLASAAKLAMDLTAADGPYPACTAEELLLAAVIREWQALLDVTDLGQPWTSLTEYVFEDTDFEFLFDAGMDGVEDDPLAHKTSGIEVHALGDWFKPFNRSSIVHPYAVDLTPREPALYDLTIIGADGDRVVAEPVPLSEMPQRVDGLEPISKLVAAARDEARHLQAADVWIPDDTDPIHSFADLAGRAQTSGLLTHQPGPNSEISETPVLSFTAHPAHPSNGQAWAAVAYFSGVTELPLAAVVSYKADPSVREEWEAIFKASD